jgi:hypothetical protein
MNDIVSTGEDTMIDLLKKLLDADGRIDAPANDRALAAAYLDRGAIKLNMGLSESGLVDLFQAYAATRGVDRAQGMAALHDAFAHDPELASLPSLLLGQIGEGLRLYARDVLLRMVTDEEAVDDTVRASVSAFEAALEAVEREGGALKDGGKGRRGWIKAHQAAAFTTLFWMAVSAGEDGADLFKAAKDGFDEAIDCRTGRYPWAHRFRAFLYAIRGEHEDFGNAVKDLDAAKDVRDGSGAALDRSIAMLLSYEAGSDRANPAEQLAAARRSLDAAGEGLRLDPDDFMASYFQAVALWRLADLEEDPQARERLRQYVEPAIDAAWSLTINAMSRAYATLAGLAAMNVLSNDEGRAASLAMSPDALRRRESFASMARDALKRFETVRPDWETRAMFIRDPVWHEVKHRKMHALVARHLGDGYDLDRLKEKFAVWPRRDGER